MTFDIENFLPVVRDFVSATISEFTDVEGRATCVRFDVQAQHGEIHVYPSTSHNSESISEYYPPIEYFYEEESWMTNKRAGLRPTYKGQTCDEKSGDGGYNDIFAQLVADAAKLAVAGMPRELLPDEIMVHAALESGGSFFEIFRPCRIANGD